MDLRQVNGHPTRHQDAEPRLAARMEVTRNTHGPEKMAPMLRGPDTGQAPVDSYAHQYHSLLPSEIKDVIGHRVETLATLDEIGIHVGQGLRTGCNRFFYVTECSMVGDGMVRVQASHALGNREFTVPKDSLRSVLRNQSDVQILRTGRASARESSGSA